LAVANEQKELEAFAKEAAKGIKTPQDLNDFSRMLKKITVEAALNAETVTLFGRAFIRKRL
jgi:transposase-like protein